MLLKISANKCRYDKGQIFPFLIAIIVVIVIIAMIMVNLGQIGLFKTDVSNAADSAALAGASILSGYLLNCGLQSDMMSGQMIVEVTALTIFIVAGVILIVTGAINEDPETVKEGVQKIVTAIIIYIAAWVKTLVTWLQMLEQGKMAWSNAKKTALQYAFQNAGIDEPRPTFKQFVKGEKDNIKIIDIYYPGADPDNLTPEQIETLNAVYFRGDDPDPPPVPGEEKDDTRRRIKNATESGFSRFMEGKHGTPGYWTWGQIRPGNISPPIVTSGYGWSVDSQGEATNSYEDKDIYESYTDCDNYVEVKVIGNVMYPLRIYMGTKFIEEINHAVRDKLEEKLGETLAGLVQWLLNILLSPILLIVAICPAGLMMGGEKEDIIEQTDENYLTVTVKRYKKESDLGLWKFRYGTVEAQAQAHAYRENDDIDIKPVLKDGVWQVEMLEMITKTLVLCVIPAALAAIAAGIVIKLGRAVCITASAACGPLAPLCIVGCYVAAAALLIAEGIILVRAVNWCIDKLTKPKAEDQFKWFYTGRHLFETELKEAR